MREVCDHAELRAAPAGSALAASTLVLFALFLISLLAAVGFAAYAGGALFSRPPAKQDTFSVPPPSYLALPTPSIAPIARAPRGTTPPPIPVAAMPLPNIQRDTIPDLFKS